MNNSYPPFRIGTRFCVQEPGSPANRWARTPLYMERGAFGSGEHETTQSCVELLEQLPLGASTRVLDLGSGTGILAIAALLCGAKSACCIDIEAEAIANGRHNCELNGFSPRVEHVCGTLAALPPDRSFELVLANIYGDILLEVAEELVAHTTSGGILLLSGILWEYNFDVRKRYEKLGCRLLKNRMLSEFSSLLLQKEG